MSGPDTKLQVLLVEDDPEDMQQLKRDIPKVFSARGIGADLHLSETFDDAFKRTTNPLHRYDLIVSDTYKGPTQDLDVQVLQMVDNYRGDRFCPLVVFSSGVKPPSLVESAFVLWADKATDGDIERAINQLLDTNIPQLARRLQDELELSASSYLWNFLENNWEQLNDPTPLNSTVLERMIRRRAAILLSDIDPESGETAFLDKHAPEYYIYPAFKQSHFNLGDVLRSVQDSTDWRVVLTPHCYLFKQENQERPRAEYVLLVKAVTAESVLGKKFEKAKTLDEPDKHKRLGSWSQSPAREVGKPDGRFWYLPRLLDIPHSFCDFLQVESIPHDTLADFNRVATLTPPYAEALQSCFAGFYASIGIPVLRPESIEDMLL